MSESETQSGHEHGPDAADAPTVDTTASFPTEAQETAFDDEELRPIVEALIFAAEDSLSAARICDIIVETTGERPTIEAIDSAVDWLNDLYASGDRAFRIRQWAGGYRMATRPEFASYLKAMYFQHRETKLSRSLLETLAIMAYKQPSTKPEVDHIRGVDSDYAIRRLMELGFVEIGGRSEGVGKPLLYRTTELFMDKFGLATLEDLPTLREMEELLNDPSFSSEKAHLLIKRGLDLPDDQDDDATDAPAVKLESANADISVSRPSELAAEAANQSSGDGAPPDPDSGLTDLSDGRHEPDENGS